MRNRLDEIEAYLRVVETASFSAAARRLRLSKSAISKRISDLEEHLGTELLRRSSRRVVATDKGAQFYQRMRPILEQFDQATAELSDHDEIRGRVSISAPACLGALFVAPLLFAFIDRHPSLQLRLELEDRRSGFLSEGFDLAVCLGPLPASSLIARRLAVCPRIVCCSPAYAQRAGLPASTEDLARHACIGQAQGSPGQAWSFAGARGARKAQGVAAHSRVEVNSSWVARSAALAGLGLAVLPKYLLVDALRDGDLIDAMPGAPSAADEIFVVFPPSSFLPHKVRAVVDHLLAGFAGIPPWDR